MKKEHYQHVVEYFKLQYQFDCFVSRDLDINVSSLLAQKTRMGWTIVGKSMVNDRPQYEVLFYGIGKERRAKKILRYIRDTEMLFL